MASYQEKVTELMSDFEQKQQFCWRIREQEDKQIQKARDRKLLQMKLTRGEEDTQLRQSYEKEDQERSNARHVEDQKDTELLRQAILSLSNLSDDRLSDSPPLSDKAEPMTPQTPVKARGKKRALSPDLPTPPMEISPFERRRRENMARNQALLNDIAPLPKTPIKLQRPRRPSTASKEPVERREILKRSAKDQKKQCFTYNQFAGPYTESESRSTPPSESLFVPPTEPTQRTISTNEVKPWDQVVVFPDNSDDFYILRCTVCFKTSDSGIGMLRHLLLSDHSRLLESEKTAAKAVEVCGVKIVDATVEWAKSGKVKFRSQASNSTSPEKKDKTVKKVVLNNGRQAEATGPSVVAENGRGQFGPTIKQTVLKKKVVVKGEDAEVPTRQQRETLLWNFQEAEIIEID